MKVYNMSILRLLRSLFLLMLILAPTARADLTDQQQILLASFEGRISLLGHPEYETREEMTRQFIFEYLEAGPFNLDYICALKDKLSIHTQSEHTDEEIRGRLFMISDALELKLYPFLIEAIDGRRYPLAKALIDCGGPSNGGENIPLSPLSMVSLREEIKPRDVDFIDFLLMSGANPSERDYAGNSLLKRLIDRPSTIRLALIEKLLVQGANVKSLSQPIFITVVDRWQYSADAQEKKALLQLAELLIRYGAPVNVCDKDGTLLLERVDTAEDEMSTLLFAAPRQR